jgi:hypothetical protein
VRLSEDRISHISHLILDGIIRGGLAEPVGAEEKVLRDIKRTFAQELQFDDDVDAAVRHTIRSLSRRVPEGSPEWEVLYRKYREEELRRRRKL